MRSLCCVTGKWWTVGKIVENGRPNLSIPLAAYFDEGTRRFADDALCSHLGDLQRNKLTILIPPQSPPKDGMRYDGEVTSFVASGPWLSEILASPKNPLAKLCYRALALALSGSLGPVDVKVIHRDTNSGKSGTKAAVEVIVPHLGNDTHLRVCIESLERQTLDCGVTVCFDQLASAAILDFLRNRYRVKSYSINPAPGGPYVIRQHFAMRSEAEFVAFQDSDDYSLPDRLKLMVAHSQDHAADIVGCHELRLDEIEQKIFAIRFPLDVNASLQDSARHAQFFPTTVVRSSTFRRLGGFSTSRSFGSDTEYLLRSHFSAKILNMDEFLYIRRKREGSLTTAPETSLDSPVRKALDQLWKSDFAAIKAGVLNLEYSSLAITHSKLHRKIRMLDDLAITGCRI